MHPDLLRQHASAAAAHERPPRRGFGPLWGSAAASNLADGVLLAGLPVLATQLTTSPVRIALVSVALMLPMSLAALPAGAIADRFDRRRVLVTGNLVRVVGLSGVLLAVMAGDVTLAALYAAAAVAGGSEVLVDTTAQAALPALVRRQELERANARLGGTQVLLTNAVGAPLGGVLAGLGIGLLLGPATLLFALAAVVLRRLPATRPPRAGSDRRPARALRADIAVGVRALARQPVLRRLAVANGVVNLGNTAFAAVFVLLIVGPLDLPASTYGWFLTALAAGGIAGSAVAERVLTRVGHTTTIALASLGTAGIYLAASTTSSWAVMGACAAALGALSMLWNVGSRVLRQTLVPDHLIGRVTATMMLVSLLATPAGGVAGGLVAELGGPRAAGGLAVVANLLGLFLLAPLALPSTRARRRPGG